MPREPIPAPPVPPGPKPRLSPAPPPPKRYIGPYDLGAETVLSMPAPPAPLAPKVRRPDVAGISESIIGRAENGASLPPGWPEKDQLAVDLAAAREALAKCHHPDHAFQAGTKGGRVYVQAGRIETAGYTCQLECYPPIVLDSGGPVVRWGRAWYFSGPFQALDVAQAAFSLVRESETAETFRRFTFDDEAIFQRR